ncbi:MAG: TadE/TadG family type IV pilus assembly protein [Boseongicola sp.]
MNFRFSKIRGLRRDESGSATIEFVILFPVIMFMFLTGFEAGYYMLRNVMLEHALDVAVRDVRLSKGQVPNFADIKASICDEALILPDCMQNVQVEMRSVPRDPGSIAAMAGPARCIDLDDTTDPATGTVYQTGQQNETMVVRVCALAQPMFPTTQLGLGMAKDGHGNYAIVATTAFVNEPGNRAQTTGTGGIGGT